jgi:beta-glucanase (GH16 family)
VARVEGGPDGVTGSAPDQGSGRSANPVAGAPATNSAQAAAQPSTDPTAPPTASDVPEDAPTPGTSPTGPAPTATEPCDPDQPPGYATSAAAKFGWGKPNRVEDFAGRLDKSWGIYNGAGHGGKGRRTPDAVTVENGVLTITGDPQGNTAGMAWGDGQKYGRWEGRVKAPASDRSYNALLLLWPDAENWPVGGEVDFMEMSDHTRQSTDMFLHYGRSNSQLHGEVKIDATQWHNWAVEWTPDHIAAFVDGKQWWSTDKKEALPPGPMHLTIQLDWFPKGGAAVQTSHMYVDWVRQYPLNAANPSVDAPADGSSAEGVPVNAKPGLVRSAVPAP